MLNLSIQSHPLQPAVRNVEIKAGDTLAGISERMNLDPRFGLPTLKLYRSGREWTVPMSMWRTTRPKDGTSIFASYEVADPASLAMVVSALIPAGASAIAGAMGLTVGTLAYSLTVAAISVVGGLVLNALIPPPKQPEKPETAYTLTGSNNAINKFAPFPYVIGKRRITMPRTATGYTETVGDDTYWHGRYTFGYGPLCLDDLRIGTTSIDEFDDVEIEFLNVTAAPGLLPVGVKNKVIGWRSGTEAMELYENDITEDIYNDEFRDPGNIATRTTRPETKRAQFDLTWARGLWNQNDGETKAQDVAFKYRWRPSGGTWGGYTNVSFEEKAMRAFRRTYNITFPAPGTYDIEIVQTSVYPGDDDMAMFNLSAIRSYSGKKLPSHPDIAEVAVRIKAGDQLNGQADAFNAMVHRLVPKWDGTGWGVPERTRHPAWSYAWMLRGNHLEKPIPTSRIDTAALKAWADQEPHWTCDHVLDTETRVVDAQSIICAAGRAKQSLTDLSFSVIRDNANGPIRHIITPRNSFGFKGHMVFPKEVHGFRVRVWSETLNAEDEIIVYADGYSSSNAEIFETLTLTGVVIKAGETQGNAYKLARYHLAQSILRPEMFEVEMDFEHLRVQRGDKVQLVHDVPKVGIGAARITEVLTDAIEIDEEFGLSGTYRVTGRNGSGDRIVFNADVAGRVFLRVSGSTLGSLRRGDLVTIEALSNEPMECLVTGIYPSQDDRARVTMVPASPGVLDADSGTIPPYDPNITDIDPLDGVPPRPTILHAISGFATSIRETDGSLTPRIGLMIRRPIYQGNLLVRLWWREAGTTKWLHGPAEQLEEVNYTDPLPEAEGLAYDVAAQFVRRGAPNSKLSDIFSVVVRARETTISYVPTGWKGIAGIDAVQLVGDDYPVPGFKEFRVYGAAETDPTLVLVGKTREPRFEYRGEFERFKVTAIDFAGNESVPTDWIYVAPKGISNTELAEGLTAVEIVSILPTTGNFAGRVVFLTTNGVLYRYNGGWTAAVKASDVTGKITRTQIGDKAISTPQLDANSVTAIQMAANSVVFGTVAAGAVRTEQMYVGAVTTEKLAVNAVNAARIQAGAVTADKADFSSMTALNIQAGTIDIKGNAVTIPVYVSGANKEINDAVERNLLTFVVDRRAFAASIQFSCQYDGPYTDGTPADLTGAVTFRIYRGSTVVGIFDMQSVRGREGASYGVLDQSTSTGSTSYSVTAQATNVSAKFAYYFNPFIAFHQFQR